MRNAWPENSRSGTYLSVARSPCLSFYKGVELECGYWLDFLVDRRVVFEPKAVEALAPIQDAILLALSETFRMQDRTPD